MVKGKKSAVKGATDSDDAGPSKTRKKADYVFEDHAEGEQPRPIGLTLHTPSDAEIVKQWLNDNPEDYGIKGVVRVCKKIYS